MKIRFTLTPDQADILISAVNRGDFVEFGRVTATCFKGQTRELPLVREVLNRENAGRCRIGIILKCFPGLHHESASTEQFCQLKDNIQSTSHEPIKILRDFTLRFPDRSEQVSIIDINAIDLLGVLRAKPWRIWFTFSRIIYPAPAAQGNVLWKGITTSDDKTIQDLLDHAERSGIEAAISCNLDEQPVLHDPVHDLDYAIRATHDSECFTFPNNTPI